MSILNAEYREYFVTLHDLSLIPQVPGDTPSNQDTPIYPREITVPGVGDCPTIFKQDGSKLPVFDENIYLKLVKSIPFKLNQSDRAKDSDNPAYLSPTNNIIQGLVTLATDLQAKAWDNGDPSQYSRVPRTSQLPQVNVEGNLILASSDFDITLIPQVPLQGLTHRIDPAENRRNLHLLRISDAHITWLRDSFDAIKAYVDSVDVSPNNVTISNTNPHEITITKTAPTSTDTWQFVVGLNLFLDNDPLLSADSSIRIASQQAIKAYVDTLASTITGLADQADLLSLAARVTIMENGASVAKANQTDLDAINAILPTKLNADGTIDVTGNMNLIATPVNNTHITNVAYVNTRLLNYYTIPQVDALIAGLQAQINALDLRIDALEASVANILIMFNNYYTKAESDARYALIGHTHTGVYHPFISGGLSGQYPFTNGSTLNMRDGIVTGHNN